MEEVQRDYNMLDAELMMFVSNLIQSMNRDATEFDGYGVDAADITAFEALGNSFEVFPPDTYYQAEVGVATETKDAAREQVLTDTRRITNRAIVKWSENSPQYKKFGVKGLVTMTDKSLLATARLVVLAATDYLAELASEGLTQQIIDDYEALAQQFENDLNASYNAVETRDSKARERVLLGNDLYSFVSKYCRLGKTIWEKVDEAKYNDYVIYKTEGGLPGKVLDMAYDTGTGVLSWDVPQSPEPIDKYELEHSTDESNWSVVYEGATNQALVPLLSGTNYFRCRAHNKNGWGAWSDNLEINVGGIDAPDWVNAVYSGVLPGSKVTAEQVEVTWANVAEANMYEVWRSVVKVDDPAGDFTKIAEDASEMYLDFDLNKNKRNYYYIIAKNETDRSEPSDVAFADVVD